MGDRILKRKDRNGRHDDTVFEIGGTLYTAKTAGADAWDIEPVSKSQAGVTLTPEEKARVALAMTRLLEADELRMMQGD